MVEWSSIHSRSNVVEQLVGLVKDSPKEAACLDLLHTLVHLARCTCTDIRVHGFTMYLVRLVVLQERRYGVELDPLKIGIKFAKHL